ncbi:MAG: hypothetical protein HFF18_11610 [Oscillospiraceae bacterium]|nr:hypothetical protein [Oscillospiraceae bacterium]
MTKWIGRNTVCRQTTNWRGVDRSWSTREFRLFIALCLAGNHEDYAAIACLSWYAGLRIHECFRIDTAIAEQALRESIIILKDFLHNWLTMFKSHEVCSRTMELYYYSERDHIVPVLGNIPLDSLTPLKVQTFLYQLQAEKHLSQRTISLIRGTRSHHVSGDHGYDVHRDACGRIAGAPMEAHRL